MERGPQPCNQQTGNREADHRQDRRDCNQPFGASGLFFLCHDRCQKQQDGQICRHGVVLLAGGEGEE